MLLLEVIKPVIFTPISFVGCHFAKEVSCIFLPQIKFLTRGEIKMLAAAFPLCGAVGWQAQDMTPFS